MTAAGGAAQTHEFAISVEKVWANVLKNTWVHTSWGVLEAEAAMHSVIVSSHFGHPTISLFPGVGFAMWSRTPCATPELIVASLSSDITS
jgi:hypothetical protein